MPKGVIFVSYIQTLDRAPRVLLIMNPASGAFQQKSSMYEIVSVFTRAGCVPMTLMTGGAGDAISFIQTYSNCNDFVVCCGGDGTFSETVTGMMSLPPEKRIPIGFIPAGSTNDVARTIGIPMGNIKKAARFIVSGDNFHHDVGGFGDDRYFSYVASFGAFTRVSWQTPRSQKRIFGHMAYLMNGVLALGDIKPWPVHVECDGFSEDGEYAFGAVTNSTSLAGIFRFDTERVSLNDGKFEVALIRHPKTPAELEEIIRTLTLRTYYENDGVPSPMVRFFRTDRIRFRPKSEMTWTLDGEFGGMPEAVEIVNHHGAIELLRHG